MPNIKVDLLKGEEVFIKCPHRAEIYWEAVNQFILWFRSYTNSNPLVQIENLTDIVQQLINFLDEAVEEIVCQDLKSYCKDKGIVESDIATEQKQYSEYFTACLPEIDKDRDKKNGENAYLNYLLEKNSFLRDTFPILINNFTRGIKRIIDCVQKDFSLLTQVWLIPETNSRIPKPAASGAAEAIVKNMVLTKISLTGSDLHKGGQQTCGLTFSVPSKPEQRVDIMFKPCDGRIDAVVVGNTQVLRDLGGEYKNMPRSLFEITNQLLPPSSPKLPTYTVVPMSCPYNYSENLIRLSWQSGVASSASLSSSGNSDRLNLSPVSMKTAETSTTASPSATAFTTQSLGVSLSPSPPAHSEALRETKREISGAVTTALSPSMSLSALPESTTALSSMASSDLSGSAISPLSLNSLSASSGSLSVPVVSESTQSTPSASDSVSVSVSISFPASSSTSTPSSVSFETHSTHDTKKSDTIALGPVKTDVRDDYMYSSRVRHSPSSHIDVLELYKHLEKNPGDYRSLKGIVEKMEAKELKKAAEAKDCDYITDSREVIRQYSFICGVSTFLLEMIGDGDVHFENLIVSEYLPVIIDLEASFAKLNSFVDTLCLHPNFGSMVKSTQNAVMIQPLYRVTGYDNGEAVFVTAKNRLYKRLPDSKVEAIGPTREGFKEGYEKVMNLFHEQNPIFMKWIDHPYLQSLVVRCVPILTSKWKNEYIPGYWRAPISKYITDEQSRACMRAPNPFEDKKKTPINAVLSPVFVERDLQERNVPVFMSCVSERSLKNARGDILVIDRGSGSTDTNFHPETLMQVTRTNFQAMANYATLSSKMKVLTTSQTFQRLGKESEVCRGLESDSTCTCTCTCGS